MLIVLVSVGYVGLLFFIAYYADHRASKGRSLVRNPQIYALSLAVYCTAWTFYGSVGRAADTGIGFLPIYLGPVVLAPLWWIVLRKIILISKSQRITSVVDFLSARYGKSTGLGVLGTLVVVAGVIPYISIQLKAITQSFEHLGYGAALGQLPVEQPIYSDTGLYIAVALAVFSILFGARHLDPNERHEGLVAAIAFESVLKLGAFLAVGIFVTFGLYQGFGDLFAQAWERPSIHRLLDLEQVGMDGWNWFWLSLLSMFAVLLLPRQFHLAVVENTSPDHVARAAWLFPLYLLLINIFVLPIAFAGLMLIPAEAADPDLFVLDLPWRYGHHGLALVAALGGLSAGASMVIVSTIALSIAVSNNMVVPMLLRTSTVRGNRVEDLSMRLLGIRRLSIVVVLLLAYAYFKWIGQQYTLVSVGLISFAAVAQFAPPILVGLYWKGATRIGAMAGLMTGFVVWFYTLVLPTLAEVHLIGISVVEQGPWGIAWLRPGALLGMEGTDNIAHTAFWSLLLNTGALVLGSLFYRPNPLELTQADLFVEIHKYQTGGFDFEVMRRQAKLSDLVLLLNRILGEARTRRLLAAFSRKHGKDLDLSTEADAELIHFAETHLAGAIGAASAKLIIRTIAKEDPISLEEMFGILEQTQEILQYSRKLEQKSEELEQTTRQLRAANERLQELDRLKADFITTVTHELRTPITSIKALSKILEDNPDLSGGQRSEFLSIIVSESERISRLINQVLDLERTQSDRPEWKAVPVDLAAVLGEACSHFQQMALARQVRLECSLPGEPVWILAARDPIFQVVTNLLANALKFTEPGRGEIRAGVEVRAGKALLSVRDNGVGIAEKDHELIFGQFTQVSGEKTGKPRGSGLGLFISKRITERYQGRIWVESRPGKGAEFFAEWDTCVNP